MDDAITVARVGHALLVAGPGQDGDAAELAAALPPERNRTAVVVGGSAVGALTRGDPWVVADLDEHVSGSVRLLAPHLAAGRPGAVPPARLLADRLGVEVVAPDNALESLGGGNVFVAGRDAGWVAYRPGSGGRRHGPRHPAPWWQEHLPQSPGPAVTQIPLGLWIRAEGAPDRPDDPLRTRVPDPERLVVVAGAPGEPAPGVSAVAALLRSLPGQARDRMVFVSYGCDLAQALAEELDAPLRTLHGIPGPDRPVYPDGEGRPTWRPFAVESVHLPGTAPVLDRWVAPVPLMTLVAPAAYRLAEGWRLDVLPRGLLAHPDDLAPDPEWSGRTGPTADLVVAADSEVPGPVVAALDDLVRDLAEDAREHLRVVPVSAFAEAAVSRLTDVPNPGRATVAITADGRVLPAAPILAARSPIAAVEPPEVAAPPHRTPPVRRRWALDRSPAPVEVVGTDPVVGAPEQAERELPPPVMGTGAPRSPLVAPTPAKPPFTRPEPGAPTAVASATPETLVRRTTSPTRPATVPPAPAPPVPVLPSPVPPRPTEPQPVAAPPPTRTKPVPAPPTPTPVEPGPVEPGPVEPGPVEPGPATGARTPPPAPPPPGPLPTAPASVTAPPSPRPSPPVPADPDPVPPATEALPAPVSIPVDARSTAEQRAKVRAALGTRYDVAGRAVARLLAERPGLRTADPAALAAELAVVRVFALDPDDGYDTDFHTCLASGLRRLPTQRGVVVRAAPVDHGYRVGTTLSLRAPVLAGVAPLPHRLPGTELLIWTTTARRLDGLLDDRRDDVVLPAHTAFRVLAEEGRRVLLGEHGTPDEQALTRLRAVGESTRTEDVARWCGDLPTA